MRPISSRPNRNARVAGRQSHRRSIGSRDAVVRKLRTLCAGSQPSISGQKPLVERTGAVIASGRNRRSICSGVSSFSSRTISATRRFCASACLATREQTSHSPRAGTSAVTRPMLSSTSARQRSSVGLDADDAFTRQGIDRGGEHAQRRQHAIADGRLERVELQAGRLRRTWSRSDRGRSP